MPVTNAFLLLTVRRFNGRAQTGQGRHTLVNAHRQEALNDQCSESLVHMVSLGKDVPNLKRIAYIEENLDLDCVTGQ